MAIPELAGGFGVGAVLIVLIAWARERWRRRQPHEIETANLRATAESLAIVTKARDELEADNARLRQQMAEDREYYMGEIERVRTQLVNALAEIDQLRTGFEAYRIEPKEPE